MPISNSTSVPQGSLQVETGEKIIGERSESVGWASEPAVQGPRVNKLCWFPKMKIQLGELLISKNGRYYRVVECRENSISLMPVNGYTLFSCNSTFVESSFRPVEAPEVA